MVGERDTGAGRREWRLVAHLRRAYERAVLAGDEREAEAVISESIAAGLAETTIDDEIIRPTMRHVGDLWADGELSIAQEHLATSISMRVITLQRDAFRHARQRSSHRVVLAGLEGEQHVVGLNMAASVLLHAGYDVRLLGPDLPVLEVAGTVVTHRPHVVGFSTATACSASHLPAAVRIVQDFDPRVRIVVGGCAVDERWELEYGIVICRHVSDAVDLVDALVRAARET